MASKSDLMQTLVKRLARPKQVEPTATERALNPEIDPRTIDTGYQPLQHSMRNKRGRNDSLDAYNDVVDDTTSSEGFSARQSAAEAKGQAKAAGKQRTQSVGRTLSEDQDMRGVPDREFEDVNSRTSSPLQYYLRTRAKNSSQEAAKYLGEEAKLRDEAEFIDDPVLAPKIPKREVAPPNEPTESLKADPRSKESDSKLKDLLELRALIKAGKFAASSKEKSIVEQLIKQQMTEKKTLTQELMDEGLR